jgi:hypothetical protein
MSVSALVPRVPFVYIRKGMKMQFDLLHAVFLRLVFLFVGEVRCCSHKGDVSAGVLILPVTGYRAIR